LSNSEYELTDNRGHACAICDICDVCDEAENITSHNKKNFNDIYDNTFNSDSGSHISLHHIGVTIL